MPSVADVKGTYELIKQVGKDAWGVGESVAPYLFGEKNIDGSSTELANPSEEVKEIPEGEYGDEPYKPTSGNETFDTVLEWFL